MQIRYLLVLVLLGLASVWRAPFAAARQDAAPITIRVRAGGPARPVSPTLYGVFFEEINRAGEGGIYAELIRNRDFREQSRDGDVPGWSLRVDAPARAGMTLDATASLNSHNTKALRLDITTPPAAVVNTGFWGIAVKKGASYRLSLYGRRQGGVSRLAASLEGANGQVYGRTTIRGIGDGWKPYAVRLRSNAEDPAARLVLTADAPGTLWLDVVSLFPEVTYKGRRNGLRPDLAQRVAALRPAFLRFPGGCYVEGNDLAQAFDWKRSVGDIATRTASPTCFWGYHTTAGLGFHEYLQWCEDLGAAPLYVVNCGMSHTEIAPMDRMDRYVQDALDAIEYANGPVTSKWGALRAKNGHPKPFGLKYVEIGNENGAAWSFGGPAPYADRYRLMYDAIKRAYPGIAMIADNPVPHPVEILDEHYYDGPAWFWENARRYDGYDRKGPRIYVGEYAVTRDCGKGNLKAALAEAAFLTGVERNADVVTMTSYAPLFVNDNMRQWNPDAIVFDAARSYGTPSYYVQQLFSANRPDATFATDVPDLRGPVGRGGIGLGTWRTQAEFKEVEVIQNGRTVYRSDFAAGADGWKPVRGEWAVVDGAYRQTSEGEDRRALLDLPALRDASDYTVRLKARKIAGAEGFLVLFRTADDAHFRWWNLGGWGNREHGVEKGDGGGKSQLGSHVPGTIEAGRWYDVRIEAEGGRVRCFLDGALIQEVEDRGTPTLAATAGQTNAGRDIIVKVVNGSEQARAATVRIDGIPAFEPNGTATTLTAPSLSDENSFAEPERIVPVTRVIANIGPAFPYTFPPRSLTVVRLRAKGALPRAATETRGDR